MSGIGGAGQSGARLALSQPPPWTAMPINDARYYKTLLICPNRQFATELGPLLAHGLPLAPIQEIPEFPNRRQIVDVLKTFDAKLCFLDFSPPGNQPMQMLEDLKAVVPNLPVIGLLSGNNPDLILRLLRSGTADFLIHPFTNDQIDAAIEKIARTLPPPARSGGGARTIAVVSAKGASGGTTIACNLAYQCKRLGAKRILLADMDPLSGTISFLLKLTAAYSFMDVLTRVGNLDADLWKQMVTPVQGVDVLLSPETPPDPTIDIPSAAPVVDFAQESYEALILDCGSPYGAWALSMARLCDDLLLVSTNEMASLQAVQRAVAYFEQHRVDSRKMKFVVNRYVKDEGLNTDAIPAALGMEPIQVIPNDPDAVQKSLMEGKPIAANTSVGKNLSALAEKLVDFRQKAGDSKKTAASKGGLRSLFR